jgi:hypothetical protein
MFNVQIGVAPHTFETFLVENVRPLLLYGCDSYAKEACCSTLCTIIRSVCAEHHGIPIVTGKTLTFDNLEEDKTLFLSKPKNMEFASLYNASVQIPYSLAMAIVQCLGVECVKFMNVQLRRLIDASVNTSDSQSLYNLEFVPMSHGVTISQIIGKLHIDIPSIASTASEDFGKLLERIEAQSWPEMYKAHARRSVCIKVLNIDLEYLPYDHLAWHDLSCVSFLLNNHLYSPRRCITPSLSIRV